jgi:adenine-specific DNA-methyltransferase
MQKQKTTTHIKPLTDQTRHLKEKFPHCFDKNGKFDFDKFKKELSENKEIDFANESYNLDWLGKNYARLLANDEATTLLKEDKVWNEKKENINAENLLIKGDNLEVLKHLSHAYYEKIKMVYIDPPYNTGGDGFVYQDDRKFSVEELSQLAGIDEEKAKRILEFTESKSNSHSAWLTFMYPRLYIAKQLLKDDGVIFVSIDDNEVAQLRMMMDEIFGEESVDSMIWRKAGIGRDGKMKNTTTYRKDHEYILIAYKNLQELNKSLEKPNWVNSYGNPDNDPRGSYKAGSISRTEDSSNEDSENYYSVKSPSGKIFKRQFDISKEDFLKLDYDNRIYWGKKKDAVPAIKIFENEKREVNTSSIIFKEQDEFDSSLYEDNKANTTSGSKELDKLLGTEGLGNEIRPKPVRLMQKLIQIGTNKNDIILDFFAGSGSTGDAVMQLNEENGRNRKYILVQLPEIINSKEEKTAYDFVKNELNVETPTIFDITKERLVRAAQKINNEVDNDIKKMNDEISKLEEKLPTDEVKQEIKTLKNKIENKVSTKKTNAFKVFETTPIWEDYDLDAVDFSKQIKLFDQEKLSADDIQSLLTTWKTYDGIPLTENLEHFEFDGYQAYYFDKNLYLIHKGFKTENLKKLLEEIDANDQFNPSTIIAFGYNFESKILREIADNVSNYTNKKKIDIDFIIRY